MSKKIFNIIFTVAAVIFFFVTLYHIKGVFYPTRVTPAWRHGLFVLINIICIYGVVKSPNWFTWFVGILMIQQGYSHGSYAKMLWQNEHSIHWISLADIIFLPILFLLLLIDKKNNKLL